MPRNTPVLLLLALLAAGCSASPESPDTVDSATSSTCERYHNPETVTSVEHTELPESGACNESLAADTFSADEDTWTSTCSEAVFVEQNDEGCAYNVTCEFRDYCY